MSRILIQGGRVIDPSQDLDGTQDVLIEDGAVAKIDGRIETKDAEVIDAARAASLLTDAGGETRAVADRALLSLLVKFGSDLELARRELDSTTGVTSGVSRVGTDGSTMTGSVTASASGAPATTVAPVASTTDASARWWSQC